MLSPSQSLDLYIDQIFIAVLIERRVEECDITELAELAAEYNCMWRIVGWLLTLCKYGCQRTLALSRRLRPFCFLYHTALRSSELVWHLLQVCFKLA